MKEEIRAAIVETIGLHAKEKGTATEWRTPLVGFASASDPMFVRLREVASPSHLMPGDMLPGAESIVAFFLPFARAIAAGNIQGEAASQGWARAYVETNALIGAICARIQSLMQSRGYAAAVTPATHNFDPERLVSDWSHRHVAFIAGLGRFGLNNMLITESGCCGRFGSVVTSAELPPDPRPTEERCMQRAGRACARCVQRCPSGALRTDGFDRRACYRACLRNGEIHASLGTADVCGKCLVGLPCSLADPMHARREEQARGAPGI